MSTDPGIGPRYQHSTKYTRGSMPSRPSAFGTVPPFKRYEDPIAYVDLPDPVAADGPGLWETVNARRSKRVFSEEPLTLEQLSQLIWATTGRTGGNDQHILRAAGSAGALYPNETYLVINNVADVSAGIYHYEIHDHRLALLSEGDFSRDIALACLEQRFCATAGVVFAWGAVFARCAQKYADRALRYIYMDAGHLGGQLQLAAQALGLGSVNVGAFFDDEVNQLLALDGNAETVVYLTAVGALSE